MNRLAKWKNYILAISVILLVAIMGIATNVDYSHHKKRVKKNATACSDYVNEDKVKSSGSYQRSGIDSFFIYWEQDLEIYF